MPRWRACRPTLPATAEDHRQSADLRRVSDHGLQPHLGQDSSDHAVGTGDLRHEAAAESRDRRFARWWCRAARCRNFKSSPIPAKLVQAGVTVPNILDAISRSNMIDSPGLIETNHQLVLTLVSGQARTSGDIGNIVVKTTPAGAPVHIGDVAHGRPIGDAGLHDGDGER